MVCIEVLEHKMSCKFLHVRLLDSRGQIGSIPFWLAHFELDHLKPSILSIQPWAFPISCSMYHPLIDWCSLSVLLYFVLFLTMRIHLPSKTWKMWCGHHTEFHWVLSCLHKFTPYLSSTDYSNWMHLCLHEWHTQQVPVWWSICIMNQLGLWTESIATWEHLVWR